MATVLNSLENDVKARKVVMKQSCRYQARLIKRTIYPCRAVRDRGCEEEGLIGGKTAEASIVSVEATGADKSLVIPASESHSKRLCPSCRQLFEGGLETLS